MEKTMHQEELEARIKGLSEEDKKIVAESLPLELILAVVTKKSLTYKYTYEKLVRQVNEWENDQIDEGFIVPRGINMH